MPLKPTVFLSLEHSPVHTPEDYIRLRFCEHEVQNVVDFSQVKHLESQTSHCFLTEFNMVLPKGQVSTQLFSYSDSSLVLAQDVQNVAVV